MTIAKMKTSKVVHTLTRHKANMSLFYGVERAFVAIDDLTLKASFPRVEIELFEPKP